MIGLILISFVLSLLSTLISAWIYVKFLSKHIKINASQEAQKKILVIYFSIYFVLTFIPVLIAFISIKQIMHL